LFLYFYLSSKRKMSEQPTKDPYTSAGESNTTGDKPLLGLVSAPVAAVGGLLDQVSRKVTAVISDVSQTQKHEAVDNKE
jgi:hypothetical protein